MASFIAFFFQRRLVHITLLNRRNKLRQFFLLTQQFFYGSTRKFLLKRIYFIQSLLNRLQMRRVEIYMSVISFNFIDNVRKLNRKLKNTRQKALKFRGKKSMLGKTLF